jgi:hypothetical protein
MIADLSPLQVLLVTLAGWINRHQQHVIEYLLEENRVLEEQLKGRRLRLTDDQRRRLAAKGRRLGRRVLRQVATIVTPDTILRWHQKLIARQWTFEPKRAGRPGIMHGILSLIVRMATENPTWGLHAHPGGAEEPGPRRGPEYGGQGAQDQRDPARPRPAIVLTDVSAGPLGRDRGSQPSGRRWTWTTCGSTPHGSASTSRAGKASSSCTDRVDADHYEWIAKITTAIGARTSAY